MVGSRVIFGFLAAGGLFDLLLSLFLFRFEVDGRGGGGNGFLHP
jgi:hypothetical protein